MRDIKYAAGDTANKINRDVELRMKEAINKEYPNLTDFKVKYDVKRQMMNFEGLTTEQEEHIHKLLSENR